MQVVSNTIASNEFVGPLPQVKARKPKAPKVAKEAPVEQAPAPVVLPKVAVYAEARARNFGLAPVTAEQVVGAALVKPAKGTNPGKHLVYGYDSNGRVPKQATIALVPGAAQPKGITPNQWAALQTAAGTSVENAYTTGVKSSTVRRAFRAGALRFVNNAPSMTEEQGSDE